MILITLTLILFLITLTLGIMLIIEYNNNKYLATFNNYKTYGIVSLSISGVLAIIFAYELVFYMRKSKSTKS